MPPLSKCRARCDFAARVMLHTSPGVIFAAGLKLERIPRICTSPYGRSASVVSNAAAYYGQGARTLWGNAVPIAVDVPSAAI